MVYFVLSIPTLRIKIGVATDVEKRLADLQTSSPEKLILLLKMHGDVRSEKALHKQFAQARIHREWFKPVPELIDYITRMLNHGSEIGGEAVQG